jgi:hypothetical protein
MFHQVVCGGVEQRHAISRIAKQGVALFAQQAAGAFAARAALCLLVRRTAGVIVVDGKIQSARACLFADGTRVVLLLQHLLVLTYFQAVHASAHRVSRLIERGCSILGLRIAELL